MEANAPDQTDSLADLAERAFKGDAKAVGEYLEEVYHRLRQSLHRKKGRERVLVVHDPTSVASSAYVKLLPVLIKKGREGGFKSPQHFAAYTALCIKRMLVDLARGRVRAPKSLAEEALDPEAEGALEEMQRHSRDPQQEASDAEDVERLRGALEALPPRLREIVNLYYFSRMTVREIAKVTSWAASTVTTDLADARENLVSNMQLSARAPDAGEKPKKDQS